MKYSYLTSFNPRTGQHFRRPIVDVEIFGPTGNFSTIALLDSGADNCLFNIEYAKEIGIDLNKCTKTSTTGVEGDRTDVYLTEIYIQVKFLDKIKIEVGFIDSRSVNGLLGQIGFFDLNRIKFERDHGTFEINPVK
ncbi:MAG: hypothetical protein UU24_C0001G0022 [Candidatus Nomurabacteria bacterium GW2011_GWA2_40_9]|uniref:Peptidase A2 domain-containing protein n=1 Tax=Candidatus Nomurabacteria bacterium GW2011_GWA2_40_9 TaxID=1618734 RepID=A0A0G0TSD2_9BACT|nr:MAG: hypothetical protein UU24_C0001G0022 [Candidatus Nomurabacteria bacterium GW2011_GWA2_40_9]